ncbi:MAG: hypothetical protein LUC92_10180 [Clostridiales bacterium]|nr:hypothetical protein [Clostridiales bacterium]
MHIKRNTAILILVLLGAALAVNGCKSETADSNSLISQSNENEEITSEEITEEGSEVADLNSSSEEDTDEMLDVPIEMLEEYYGDYKIIDDPATNKYARISKSYTDDDKYIYKTFSIHSDGIVIDGNKLEAPVINTGSHDEKFYAYLAEGRSQFGFKDDECKWFYIKDNINSDISFSCYTDGVTYYYAYGGNYLKMEKL